MANQNHSQHCSRQGHCSKIYQQLAGTKDKPMVFKITVAFLLPLLVFIAALAAFGRISEWAVESESLRTALTFSLALAVASLFTLIVTKRIKRNC